MITYKSNKLSTEFPVKDKTGFKQKNSVVCQSECLIKGFTDDHIGQTNRRIVEKVRDQNIRDKNSHLLKHTREKCQTNVWESDFEILGNSQQSNFERKITESLFKRKLRPTTLNVKVK